MDSLFRTRTGLGLTLMAALTGACGDDPVTTISASASESDATTASSVTDPGATTVVTTDGTASNSGTTTEDNPTGGMSNSESVGTSESTSTGQISATEPPDTSTGPIDETTTTGPIDETTTTGPIDETTTTTGETSTGVVDETTTTAGETEGDACPLALSHEPCDADSNDALHAIGLNCTSLGGIYENNVNAVAVSNLVFQAAPAMFGERAWQVASNYGTYVDPNTNAPFWTAREGSKLLMISSGLLPPADPQGTITIDDGDVYNDVAFGGQWDSDTMPPPMSPLQGSPDPMGFTNCDGTNDCSNTLQDQWQLGGSDPEDKMWFSFDVTAPSIAAGDTADANGYTFEFAYFSAEFPEYVDSTFNDIFVVWQNSEDYTGNVVFINDQPLTVTALWPIDFQEFDPHLEGTGYIADGGATGWYKAIGGVKPGETFTLAFSIFDMGDSTFDTTALIDNWLWDCEGCVPSEVDDCGITPQPM